MNRIKQLQIRICMGSSCFARGNRRNLEAVQEYLNTHSAIPATVSVEGCLCEAQCADGPHIRINGRLFNAVDPVGVLQLLDAHLLPQDERT